MDRHRQLRVWQLGIELVHQTYALAWMLPMEERFITVPQLKRAAWSVPNNIAEGNAKRGRGELRRYLDCALGSLAEIDTMVCGLRGLYELDEVTAQQIDALRKGITGGIFGLLSHGRQ